MKNLRKLFGIIFAAAIIVCAMTACDLPDPLPVNKTPVAGDYEISDLAQTFGSVTAVTITPKSGKSSGKITIYYAGSAGTTYTKSPTLPTAKGSYAVTFDVAAASGWNAATGLSAGNVDVKIACDRGLVIGDNKTPVAGDFDINIQTPSADNAAAVTITPKSGKSGGTITIYYAGTGSTTYEKSATPPTAAGTYVVTFDVAAATGWNAATGLSAGNLIIGATGTQTLSVQIIGGPNVGKRWTADVQKNYSGAVTYQWLREGQNIRGEDYFEYIPSPMDTGKKISVTVKCGGKEITSQAITVVMPTYTVNLDRWNDWIWAEVKIGDSTYGYAPYTEEGFTCQWLRDDQPIDGETDPQYNVRPEDAGKTIKAKVSGYNQNVTSTGMQISAAPYVPPAVTINYEKYSGRVGAEFDKILREVDEAYNNNKAGCKDVILSTGASLKVEFYDGESDRGATIKNYKLNIRFSCDHYDTFDQDDRNARLDQIGEELRFLVDMAETIGLEYSGNYEDIRMAKLAKPEPKTEA